MTVTDDASAEISPADAARLAAVGDVVLLDVREQDEWDAGHAAAAVHRPLGHLRSAAVPAGRPIVAICHSGHRSAAAAQHLRAAGFDAHSMTGGMTAWVRAGLGLVTDDGRPATV